MQSVARLLICNQIEKTPACGPIRAVAMWVTIMHLASVAPSQWQSNRSSHLSPAASMKAWRSIAPACREAPPSRYRSLFVVSWVFPKYTSFIWLSILFSISCTIVPMLTKCVFSASFFMSFSVTCIL